MNNPVWYVTKEGWKEHFKKWFPDDKDITTKGLNKQRKGATYLQLLFMFMAVALGVPMLYVSGTLTDVTLRLAVLGGGIGTFGFFFAMYAQWRVREAEINFELRLREALKLP